MEPSSGFKQKPAYMQTEIENTMNRTEDWTQQEKTTVLMLSNFQVRMR